MEWALFQLEELETWVHPSGRLALKGMISINQVGYLNELLIRQSSRVEIKEACLCGKCALANIPMILTRDLVISFQALDL